MLLTLTIVFALLAVAGFTEAWSHKKNAAMWRRSYEDACKVSQSNARIAKSNADLATIERKRGNSATAFFYITWFVAVYLAIRLWRLKRAENPAA